MSNDDLNLRQRKFVNAYIASDGNAALSYLEAGYKNTSRRALDTSACHLANNPKIKKAIENELLTREKSARITFDRKISWLGDIAEDGMQKIDVKSSPDGQDRIIMQDPRSSIAAISEANRMQGHHAAINANLNIQQVSFTSNVNRPDAFVVDNKDEKPVTGETMTDPDEKSSD